MWQINFRRVCTVEWKRAMDECNESETYNGRDEVVGPGGLP